MSSAACPLLLRRLPVRIRLAAASVDHLCHHRQRAAGFGMRGRSSCSAQAPVAPRACRL